MSKTLLFFGNERILSGVNLTKSPILEQLIKDGYNIRGVVLHNHESKSRKQKTQATFDLATKNNIPIYFPNNSYEIEKIVNDIRPDAAVLIAYGMIIPESVISSMPDGIINVHPSLLPKYRGPSPIESAIINGDEKIGVSIMKLSAKMDAGPVYLQAEIRTSQSDTKIEIAEKLLDEASKLLHENLEKILDGSIQPTEQDESLATYTKKFSKEDSLIDTTNLSASQAQRLVVAYQDYPKAKINYKNNLIIVTKAHVSDNEEIISIKCNDGKYLVIDELFAPSGKKMSSQAFLRGYSGVA